MTTHNHRRSDYPQPALPPPPKPPRNASSLRCGSAIEYRIRTLLTWHAGTAGLISDDALDTLAQMYFAGAITLTDLRKIASEAVYKSVVMWIDAIVSMKGKA